MNRVYKMLLLISMVMMSIGAAFGASLGSYQVDIHQTSVSGVSAGANMAVQIHIAHSKNMIGIGVIAGGPYYCSQGDHMTAYNECWKTGIPTVDPLKEIEKQAGNCVVQENGSCARYFIDDPENLKDDMVYVFSGANDTKVGTQVVDKLYEQYQRLGLPPGNILYIKNDVPAGHSMVTDDFGNACSTEQGHYINDCDYDFAGEMLKHLYGSTLNPPVDEVTGQIVEFDQTEFLAVPPNQVGMAEKGYAYIPPACAEGESCRVHIVAHGCIQYAGNVGDSFYKNSGYNEWADSNNIITLYPQTIGSDTGIMMRNPKAIGIGIPNQYGCMDWGEYNYQDPCFHTQEGVQLKAIMNMVKRLAGEEFQPAAITDSCEKNDDCCCFELFGFCFYSGPQCCK